MIIRCITWKTYIYYTAYAGKTCDIWQGRGSLQDHPRIRGKDMKLKSISPTIQGSPPHTRERLCPLISEVGLSRDHPRIRGKDAHVFALYACPSGSPPHTRERRYFKGANEKTNRITPAYAGKTFSSMLQLFFS